MNKRILHWLILIVGIILIINLSRSVADLLGKGKIIEKTENRLSEAQKKNRQLKEKLAEVQSESYVEKQAREKLNLAREGEVVVILPKITPEPEVEEPREIPNWQKWIEIFK